MHVIGTAGHVDHGKSTLVEALTGMHPDRLKEEKEREMTIDLGFAWLTLPGGEEVGIVDVPGHRDFIENMLAGVGGIYASLFVIAADEGVMPQTREHLAILNILQVPSGVVALTKIDLVDAEWLELVQEDIRLELMGTVLESAPIIPVSARNGSGIALLLEALSACLAHRQPRPDLNKPRLPIDRVFSIAGFGTVVTGTLADGQLRTGEEIIILPSGLKGRIRGLQTHKHKEEVAIPGSRTAVNISGVPFERIKRGELVAHLSDYQPTRRLDVHFRLIPDVVHPLQHNIEVKLFIGTAEVLARLRLLGTEELIPGQEAWLQLELEQPVVAVRGDHYILRRPSPGETLGGGTVVDPMPKGRHKRFSQATLERLQTLSRGSPADILLQAIVALGAASIKDVVARSNLDISISSAALEELLYSGAILPLEASATTRNSSNLPGNLMENDLIISKGLWDQIAARAVQEVANFHQVYPLRPGLAREELKSRLKPLTQFSPRLFNAAMRKLVADGTLEDFGPLVRLPGYIIKFNPADQRKIDLLLARFAGAPYTTPSVKECQAEVGDEIYSALVELGYLTQVSAEVVFRKQDFDRMLTELRLTFSQSGSFTASQVRDHFNTSRKYILAFLEYLDAVGITVRDGDYRRLK